MWLSSRYLRQLQLYRSHSSSAWSASGKMKVYISVLLFMLHVLHSEGQPLLQNAVHVPVKVLRGPTADTCPSEQDTIDAKNELRQNISTVLAEIVSDCGGIGWRRVAYLDMTDPTQSCPSGLALKYYPGVRSCGRSINDQYNNDTHGGCWSTFYNTGVSQYSRVCGRVRGYQFGQTDAFRHGTNAPLDGVYANGVGLTYGQSGNRNHIWTFVSGHSNVYDPIPGGYDPGPGRFCQCAAPSSHAPPPYVGNDYFCDSGRDSTEHIQSIFYPDPLWTGQNCASSCCEFNHPPYFTKILPLPTSDNIELRTCCSYTAPDCDVPIDQVEIYVHS